VDDEAGRLVDDQQVVVLVDDVSAISARASRSSGAGSGRRAELVPATTIALA
jgi:hypothetical protein